MRELIVSFLLSISILFAQELKIPTAPSSNFGGAVNPPNKISSTPLGIQKPIKITGSTDEDLYATTTFTFSDIVVFSYFDNTIVNVYDQSSTPIGSDTLNSDEYRVFSPGEGIYRIEGNNTYSVLIGDPISNFVLGYFAVNENGSPLSTRLNTYMPQEFSTDHFIIFAYEDNTEYELNNLTTGTPISAGILNEGEHYVYEGNSVFLSLNSNKPMSALTYNDQGYYYPAANGSFCGQLFYGFSGYVGGWTNGVIVTAYENETDVLITNTETGDTLWAGMLNEGEVYAHTITTDTYVTVETSKNATVANTPYAGYSSNYYHLTRHIDRGGFGIGTLFYVPTIAGRFDVFSYEDNNDVTITNMEDSSVVWTGTLMDGEGYSFNSFKARYKVESTANVSVVTSFGGSAGADFMPLNYSVFLPDLSISSGDIVFNPDSVSTGDPVEITASIHNYSSLDAQNVTVRFFDGHPENGGIQIGSDKIISQINSNSTENVTVNWVAPNAPEVHYIYVYVDPNDEITESNESNNLASKPLLPNDDLLPPLSIQVEAPFALEYDNGNYVPNPFEVVATIFNNGEGEAINIVATLNTLPNGLELDVFSYPMEQNVGNLLPGEFINVSWTILANGNQSGILVYNMDFTADNAESKTVNRGVNIPDIDPPAPPENLRIVSIGEGEIALEWDQNSEDDFFGYNLYYDSDASGTPYNGTDALEGTSPINVANNQAFTLTGLDPTKTYYFSLTAYDTTPNESDYSTEVSAKVTSVEGDGEIPTKFELFQNYPNPFNPTTIISYNVPKREKVVIKIYDMLGNEISTLVNEIKTAGSYNVTFNNSNLASGVYLYRMQSGSFTETKKLLLLK